MFGDAFGSEPDRAKCARKLVTYDSSERKSSSIGPDDIHQVQPWQHQDVVEAHRALSKQSSTPADRYQSHLQPSCSRRSVYHHKPPPSQPPHNAAPKSAARLSHFHPTSLSPSRRRRQHVAQRLAANKPCAHNKDQPLRFLAQEGRCHMTSPRT